MYDVHANLAINRQQRFLTDDFFSASAEEHLCENASIVRVARTSSLWKAAYAARNVFFRHPTLRRTFAAEPCTELFRRFDGESADHHAGR